MSISNEKPIGNCEEVFTAYGNMLFRLCFIMLGSEADAKDAVQDTVVSYLTKKDGFKNAEHEKAWLITTAKNKCRDIFRSRLRYREINTEDLQDMLPDEKDSNCIEILMSIPEKYRLVLTLYYIEGYKVNEIAKIIGKTPSAVKMRLQTGRKMLKEIYIKEGF